MKQTLFLLLIMVFLSANGQSPDRKVEIKNPGVEKQTSSTYTFKILPSNNDTWCYDIYRGGEMIIHQVNIPGLPGNDGFKNKSDAEKVARLVIKKLKSGEMPPTVTIDELKNLEVLEKK
ncbi:MAG: DUF4907 domain-containing protein [Bacteroidales bacterium]|nr:DUF4907 domain-containing protein [Bacteroidales bacterium]